MMSTANRNYTSQDIEILEGLEGARRNPGMYIGNTSDGSGLHKMAFEIIDNAVDESLTDSPERCTQITITIQKNNSISVFDNGRGIPVDIHPKVGRSTVEVVMTNLHAGGKFSSDKSSGAYAKTGGLHGVGASVVNALSDYMEVSVYRQNCEFFIRFEKGVAIAPLEQIGEKIKKRGTNVVFLPSLEIFGEINWDIEIFKSTLKEAAFLNPSTIFELHDERPDELVSYKYSYPAGLRDFVEDRLASTFEKRGVKTIHEPLHITGMRSDVQVEFAMMWCNPELDSEEITCFTNNIKQISGGSHLIGLRSGISKSVLEYMEKFGSKREKVTIISADVTEGLIAVVSVRVNRPVFSSQTKEVLTNPEVRTAVADLTYTEISAWLDKNPKTRDLIFARIILSAHSREAAKKARDTKRNEKTIFDVVSLPGKLADCQERDPEHAEIFIVEGESAGGSAKQGRNRKTQAILALQGKILNVEKVNYEKIIVSKEILAIIASLGMGIGKSFDIARVRYHKIVIMTDADVDGYHIRTLLLTFFYRYMKPIIDLGYLYIAQPPLYKVKIGTRERYIKNDEILNTFLIERFLEENIVEIAGALQKDVKNFEEIFAICRTAASNIRNLSAGDAQVSEIALRTIILSGARDATAINLQEIASLLTETLNCEYLVDLVDDQLHCQHVEHNVTKHQRIKINAILGETDFRTNLEHAFEYFVNGNIRIVRKNKEIKLKSVVEFAEKFYDLYREGLTVQRFKGLGEMNAKQLGDTTMVPENRQLLQVVVGDLEKTEDVFRILMGDEVEPRREFIENSSYLADEIDL